MSAEREPRWRQVAAATGLVSPDGGTQDTIFAQMSALATATGSINLGQGFPDSDGPPSVLGSAVQAILHGSNQYPPGPGLPRLRSAIASHQRHHYGIALDPDSEILVTTGATEAIAAALLALAAPGEEVLTLEPHYDSYAAGIAMAGARHVGAPLRPTARGFRLDAEAFRAAITPATRIVLLNTPHNPTGTVLREHELSVIAEAAVEHDLIVLTDEVYEHLTFDGARHIPIATLPQMAERTLTISSSGKTFSLTGWKIGWVSGPPGLVEAVRSIKQFLTYATGAPLQPAIADALMLAGGGSAEATFVVDLAASLARRRDLLTDGLTRAGFAPVPVEGTYFVIADARDLIERHGFADGAAFCRALPGLCGVVAIPVSAFTHPGSETDDALSHHLRFTFTKSEETLAEAVRRLSVLGEVRP